MPLTTTTGGLGANAPPITEAASNEAPVDVGLLGIAQALLSDLQSIALAHLELASLEAQKAGESLGYILVCGLFIGFFMLSTWLALMGSLAFWLIGGGMTPATALLLFAVINVIGVGVCVFAVRRRSYFLRFPVTVRSLQFATSLDSTKERS